MGRHRPGNRDPPSPVQSPRSLPGVYLPERLPEPMRGVVRMGLYPALDRVGGIKRRPVRDARGRSPQKVRRRSQVVLRAALGGQDLADALVRAVPAEVARHLPQKGGGVAAVQAPDQTLRLERLDHDVDGTLVRAESTGPPRLRRALDLKSTLDELEGSQHERRGGSRSGARRAQLEQGQFPPVRPSPRNLPHGSLQFRVPEEEDRVLGHGPEKGGGYAPVKSRDAVGFDRVGEAVERAPVRRGLGGRRRGGGGGGGGGRPPSSARGRSGGGGGATDALRLKQDLDGVERIIENFTRESAGGTGHEVLPRLRHGVLRRATSDDHLDGPDRTGPDRTGRKRRSEPADALLTPSPRRAARSSRPVLSRLGEKGVCASGIPVFERTNERLPLVRDFEITACAEKKNLYRDEGGDATRSCGRSGSGNGDRCSCDRSGPEDKIVRLE
mmetsp:Transcript_29157/g.59634  ORF Transcript_29157/g.59634 Transcript_29157/m.59634 type:complete len:442 (+) Transcript_29157:180-1505(+)